MFGGYGPCQPRETLPVLGPRCPLQFLSLRSVCAPDRHSRDLNPQPALRGDNFPTFNLDTAVTRRSATLIQAIIGPKRGKLTLHLRKHLKASNPPRGSPFYKLLPQRGFWAM